MNISFINQLQKLQKVMLMDESRNQRYERPVNTISSVHLLKKLIEPEIQQKKELGMYPRIRYIDQKFREKVRQNSDVNVINAKIISKNYHLRTSGDNDRALGIELLVEELFRRKTIMTERNINMITFIGEETPVQLTKHTQLIKMLLELSQIEKLAHIKDPSRKGKMVRLPITLKHVNELISGRNVREGHKYSMNHNLINMFSTEPNLQSTDVSFQINQGKIRQKRPTRDDGEINFFNLNKGPLLQNTDRVEIHSGNGFVRNKKSGYTNFMNSFVQDELYEDSIPDFQKEVFGAKLNDDATMDNLFSFNNVSGSMEEEIKEGKNEGSLMNAFTFQGSKFKENPFSFKPSVPENYKPFQFGCMSNSQTKRMEPVINIVDQNIDNFKKDSEERFTKTKAFTGYDGDLNTSGTILGSKIFSFENNKAETSSPYAPRNVEIETPSRNDFFGFSSKRDTEEIRHARTTGATPQTKTSSIYQMLAEQYREDEKSDFKSSSQSAPKYWEDLDATAESFLVYQTLNNNARKFEPINIISEERNKELCQKIEENQTSLIKMEDQKVSLKYVRKNLDLVLMGIPGDLFILNEETDQIALCNFDKTLPYVSQRGLSNLLTIFEIPATQIYKLYKLTRNLRLNPLENSYTNKTLHTILDEYLKFVNQVILDIPESHTLLQYIQELKELFSELNLIYKVFYRPTMLRTSTSYEMELEALKNLQTDPNKPLENKKNFIDIENLNMLHHLLSSLQRSSSNVALINYIFKQCMVPILSTLRLICFKGHNVTELETKLKIGSEKDADFNFTFKRVPDILKKCINDVMYCAQNFSMLKSSDEELYRILLGQSSTPDDQDFMNPERLNDQKNDQQSDDLSGVLELIVDPKNVPAYQRRVNDRFRRIENRIRDIFLRRKMEADDRRLDVLRQKLTKLKKMKLQVEIQKEDKYRMKELERFKRTQLNNILQAQVIETQGRKALRRKMEIEFEKSLLLDDELRAKQAEREKIIQEIRDLGSGFDEEIEHMIDELEERRQKQREALEQQQLEEDQKLIEKQKADDSQSSKGEKKISNNKDIAKNIKLIDDGQGYGVDIEELRTDTQAMKARVGDIIGNSQVIPNRAEEEPVIEDGAMEEEIVPNSKLDQATIIQEMIQNPFEVIGEQDEFENKEIRKGLFMEQKTRNLISLQTLPPPLTVVFNATVTQNIKAQAALTNRLILKIIFEKYDLMSILTHFKKIFLGQRGDYTEQFIDLMYGKEVTVGPGEIKSRSLLNMESLLNGWKYQKNEEIDWDLQFQVNIKKNLKWEDLQNISIISTNLNELVRIKCKLPPPVSFLMNSQVVNLYFRIMCFASKFRLHNRILGDLWKHIHIDIQNPELGIPKQICRNLMFIRHKAHDFSNKFLDYFYHLIIETGWKKLCDNLMKAKTFNNLFKFQARFLTEITRMGMITSQNSSNQQLLEWMQLIVRLNMLCRRITVGFEEEIDFKQLNDQVKEIAARLTLIQDSFGMMIDTMVERIKFFKPSNKQQA